MNEELRKELEKKREEIIKQIETYYQNNYFEVNGRRYELSKLNHQFRVEVLAVYSQIEPALTMENYGFMLNEDFKRVMKKIEDRVLFEGMQISKRPNHWEEYEEDYLDFVALSMKVICYPFYKKKLNTSLKG